MKAGHWLILVCIVPVALVRATAAESFPDELIRLNGEIAAEKDPAKQEELRQRFGEVYQAQAKAELDRLYPLWRDEADAKEKREVGRELAEAAVRNEKPELVTKVATDGQFANREIKIPEGTSEKITLHEVRSFDPPPADQYGGIYAWVIRRMTRDCFELWQPFHGWLFDKEGRVLNEAKPPRRDGTGRQWYGAFLPDGRWVTTDLWEMDRTLSFFSRAGKWRKDILSASLVPAKRDDTGYELPLLIGWCRCDKEGKGFVLSVGANGGRGQAWVSSEGKARLLNEPNEPWKLCYPRDLEPKGTYTYLACPADNGKAVLSRQEDAHGTFVGFPVYEAPGFSVRVPDGETFGFWPNSSDVYIATSTTTEITDASGNPDNGPVISRTWFYHADGSFAGWIAARRFADRAKENGMLFLADDGRVAALGKDYRIERVEEFHLPDGSIARPRKIFPDLRIGFFERGAQLILARW
ncbi:MAG: hypothetical protein ACR2HH_12975 [Chthoniobacterales bacterium]